MKPLKNVCKISKNGKAISSNIKGAKFVSRDTYSIRPQIRDGKTGLIKEHGCVVFRGNRQPFSRGYYGTASDQAECLRRFYDKCPASSAWLVIPVGKDWHWYRVDSEIKFSW